MRILVADDDEDIRAVLDIVLGEAGFEVETAADGVEALDRLRREGTPPGLVLVDLMMPRLDGEDFVKRMRADPALSRVPIVVMSGHHEARRRAAELGATECLVKPVELDALMAMVHRYAAVAPAE